MPTPIPIIAVTCGAKDGMSRTCANRLTNARPRPMPKSAVMVGSPMARTDPNAIRRMMMAASTPMNSDAGCDWSVNMEPPRSTCSRGEFACWAMLRMWDARSTGTSFACTSKRTSAYAILPSCEMKRAPAGAYGGVTDTTCGCLARSSTTGCIWRRTSADRTLPGPRTLNTRSPVSPFRAKSLPRTSKARCDSVPGRLNVFNSVPPATWPSTLMPMSARIQAPTTKRRRR